MNTVQLFAHFNRISEAPDAIPRFRRFILDLAVRGKLVPQDPNDVPASKLLKSVQVEKVRRIQSGELRTPRAFDFFKEREDLFSLPGSWVWCRLSDVGAIIGGGTPSGGDDDNFTDGGNGIPWLTPADLGKHQELYISHGARDLTEKGFKSSSATMMPEGSVLFTSRAPIGYVAIAGNAITTNQGFKSVVPYVPESSRYVALYLRAFGPWVDSRAPGTTFREVSGKIVSSLPFPLPPLAEQHRIVAKVDELMVLCDQLKTVRDERERRRDSLAVASLNRIGMTLKDERAFREHARFHLTNLSKFTNRPDQIPILRKKILDLAVRGKLVPQDPKDEPASELINRIKTRKAQLVREGKIRAQEALPPVTDDAIDYSLPINWELTRIGDLLTVIRGASPRPKGDPKYFSKKKTKYHWVKISDIRKYSKNMVLYDTDEFLTEAGKDKSVLLPKGTLIVTNSATIGVPVFIGFDGACIHDGYLAFPYFPSIELSKEYFYVLFQTLQSYAIKMARGMAQLNLNTSLVRKFPLGLPPLAEQNRIVAKVDELIGLCDRLEKQLTTAQNESGRLLESALHQALEPALDEVSA